MNNKSRKAKGRYLQNVVRDTIRTLFPYLKKRKILGVPEIPNMDQMLNYLV